MRTPGNTESTFIKKQCNTLGYQEHKQSISWAFTAVTMRSLTEVSKHLRKVQKGQQLPSIDH